MYLDVVRLVAALVAQRRVGRHVGEAVDAALERELAVGHFKLELDTSQRCNALVVVPCGVVEARQTHAVLR